MFRRITAPLVLGLVMTGSAAGAPLEAYFASTDSCYGRSYSTEHLERHRGQQVIDFAISHFPNRQELLGMDSPFQPYPDTPKLVLRLDVWLRGQDRSWQDHAICEASGEALTCAIECDGGSFQIHERSDDRLLVKPDKDLFFAQCDAGDAVIRKTPEDSSYLLSPCHGRIARRSEVLIRLARQRFSGNRLKDQYALASHRLIVYKRTQ
ncbi:hypothetical protein [Labrenzia sp. VG12]|uniref:hypothetical protein n=1 Tax=Labrenzia sp. VG12 TaxID=2021862 RepID=UPI0012FDFA43|nr:hypothetical protein [Labrenzia sp. VG12]